MGTRGRVRRTDRYAATSAQVLQRRRVPAQRVGAALFSNLSIPLRELPLHPLDVEIHLVLLFRPIRAGDKVVMYFGAANRDDRVFERPDDFVVDRTPPTVAVTQPADGACREIAYMASLNTRGSALSAFIATPSAA